MILNYYNLREQPFGVTPDPRYLYLGPTHREALASLAYGIQNSRGFMCLIASPGMGKTTILFHLLQQIESSARVAFLCQTLCEPQDILRGVLRDLGVTDDSSDLVQLGARLNDVLLAEARLERKVVLVIDEAQNLDDRTLELVRLLSNFETTREKLMQIVLAGQPQLAEKLASPQLLQLRQRMSIVARLEPLNLDETRHYIAHRLRLAGHESDSPLFTREAEALIAKQSGGIPRNINNICFNALSLGYVFKQKTIAKNIINEVLVDLDVNAATVDRRREVPTHGIADWFAQKRALAISYVFAWQTLVVICALLIVPLGIAFSGKRRAEAGAPRTKSSAAEVAERVPPATSVQVSVADPLHVETLSPRSGAPLQTVSRAQLTNTPAQIKKSSAVAPNNSSPSDPAKLWEKVKKQDSNAAVTLARMYLEGTEVPQNCEQARVLLLAASKRGNARASDLLNNYAEQCH